MACISEDDCSGAAVGPQAMESWMAGHILQAPLLAFCLQKGCFFLFFLVNIKQ